MLLKDLLATSGNLPEEALNTPVIVSLKENEVTFFYQVQELMSAQEAHYVYDGEIISESDLAGKMLKAQSLGDDPIMPYRLFIPKNSIVLCVKPKYP